MCGARVSAGYGAGGGGKYDAGGKQAGGRGGSSLFGAGFQPQSEQVTTSVAGHYRAKSMVPGAWPGAETKPMMPPYNPGQLNNTRRTQEQPHNSGQPNDTRRARGRPLKPGETRVYTLEGNEETFTTSGRIDVVTPSGRFWKEDQE